MAGPACARRLEIWLPMVVVALDQLTKALVRAAVPVHDSVTIIPGLMDFTHVRNTGAAFGFLNAVDFPFKTLVIAAGRDQRAGGRRASTPKGLRAPAAARARWGLALIVGGAAGNLIDRLTVGSVVDFVDVYWRTWHFWAFNVADSAITVGVVVMILDMIGAGTPCIQDCLSGARLADLRPGPITIYTYGVLLAAAYLLGLKLAMVRARKAAGSTRRGSSTSASTSSSARWSARSCCC